MKVWNHIRAYLSDKHPVMLLYVLDSEGSSPGRKGFHMAVLADGRMTGTIGGGIMEHKLVELAKHLLTNNETEITLKHQYHDKQHSSDQSGMICSGKQTVAIIPLLPIHISIIEQILQSYRSNRAQEIVITPKGIEVNPIDKSISYSKFEISSTWKYQEIIGLKNRIHIFGGGHVGLALSHVMSCLDYYIIIYDNRPDLNTMADNIWGHEKHIIDYEDVLSHIDIRPNDCAAIVTFGYRTDKILLKQLYNQNLSYLGLMGSDDKIKKLYKSLEDEGIPTEALSHVFAPIGMHIYSKTTTEIAISIAGEIIREKNKTLPTGRSY